LASPPSPLGVLLRGFWIGANVAIGAGSAICHGVEQLDIGYGSNSHYRVDKVAAKTRDMGIVLGALRYGTRPARTCHSRHSSRQNRPPGRLGLRVNLLKGRGATIEKIIPSCTFKHKVQIGDCITMVAGKALLDTEDLRIGSDKALQMRNIPKGAVYKARDCSRYNIPFFLSNRGYTYPDPENFSSKRKMAIMQE